MKKLFSFTLAGLAIFFCSCSKEDLNNTTINSTTSANNAVVAKGTKSKYSPNKLLQYGAMINPPSNTPNWTTFQLNVADQLGVSCLRARTLVPSNAPTPLVNTKYKIVLNFNRGDYNTGTPMPFFTNINQYKNDLKKTLAVYKVKPVMAVIENEESNKLYYSGSAKDYIKQLNAAINVMHNNGIKVANGGLTTPGLNYLVYQDFMQQGKTDSAQMFMQLTGLTPKALVIQERGAFIDTLLQNYTTMKLDYVNFHWKGESPNSEAFKQVVAYLQKRTGKPVISNELGQFDTDPNTLQELINKGTEAKMPYMLWYSPDENTNKKDAPLQHSDASLTPSGVMYQSYLKK